MTESPDQLTVRVVLKPTTAAPPPLSSVGYRWDRIVGAAVVAGGLLVLSIWMYSSSDTTSVDAADQLVDAVGAAGDRVASAALAPDLVPESKPEPKPEAEPEPKPDAQPEPKPSPAEPAQQSDPRAELAQPSEQLAPEPLQTAASESAAADLVAVTPQQLEPETASVDPVADTAQPRQSALVSQAPDAASSNDTADSSVLRSPPVTAISTRILSPQVKRFLITDAVASREPVGDASAIREDKKVKGLVKVIAYSEVDGRAGDTLRYLWLRRDKVVANVPVRVGSDSWRSYTSKFLNADMRGHWWVELQTSDGELLAVTEFEY